MAIKINSQTDSKSRLPAYAKWPTRLLLSAAVATIVYAIIWLSSQFRNPPGWSWLALVLLLMTYLTFEVVTRVQLRLSALDMVRSETGNMILSMLGAILAGVLVYTFMFYGFK